MRSSTSLRALSAIGLAFAIGASFACGSSDSLDDAGAVDAGPTVDGGEVAGGLVPNFALEDVNPTSLFSGQEVSPRDFMEKVSGWYFTHAS